MALDQYDALTEESTATFDVFEGYIAAAVALGRTEEALLKAQQATNRFPEDARAYDVLAGIALQVEDTDTARAALQKALELNPNLESAQQKMQSL